jgi:hypothetical protein
MVLGAALALTGTIPKRTRGRPGHPPKTSVAMREPTCVGGADGGAQDRAHRFGGLSPRVRGRPVLPSCAPVRTRSIPACAGPTALTLVKSRAIEVYPRVCGADTC